MSVTTTGSKLWRWRYRFKGVPKLMALGSYPELTLERARELHKAMKGMLAGGLDPMEVRKQEKESYTQTTKTPVVMTTVKVLKDEKGKEHTLDEYRGKILMLNFFASW